MEKIKSVLEGLEAHLLEQVLASAEGCDAAIREDLAAVVRSGVAEFTGSILDAIEELTPVDPGTSVIKESALSEVVETEFGRALRYKRPLSVIELEIDGYDEVLAEHGEAAGDAVRRTMVLDCCRGLRASDIVGRHDRSAFTVLLPETSLDGATRVAHRLSKIFRETPVLAGNVELSYSVSIGVATMDGGDAAYKSLTQRACRARDEAREEGPGQVSVN